MRRCVRAVLIAVALAAVPGIAFAQASIVGTVKDASGAVLPGVTVEASSPALIEKTRSVVTGGTGQYSIENLRPGTYTVTFTLTGFATAKREGIELTGSFTATVNADMKVGAVSETVTVSGEAPVVDVTSARSPAGRSPARRSTRSRRHGNMAASSRSSRRSTFKATTSAEPRVASSTCSRSTAGGETRDRSRSTA